MTAPAKFIVIAALLTVGLRANAVDKDKKDKPAAPAVDSGSFGVYINGQRVLTETFNIQQQNGNSSVVSQLNEGTATGDLLQKSEMNMTASGELLRYDWTQVKPAVSSLTVLPNNEFLLEKITPPGAVKAAEQPFLMPNTSAIVDNNFFVHRELLAWRFLASSCQPGGGGLQCKREPAEFGILVPQDRTSLHVRMELIGKDKTSVHGVDRELLRLKLAGEETEWALWVDELDHFKLIKISIPEARTEVVRD